MRLSVLRVMGEEFSWLVRHIVSKCQDLRKVLKSSWLAASQLYCQWFPDSSCSGLESEAEHGKWTVLQGQWLNIRTETPGILAQGSCCYAES